MIARSSFVSVRKKDKRFFPQLPARVRTTGCFGHRECVHRVPRRKLPLLDRAIVSIGKHDAGEHNSRTSHPVLLESQIRATRNNFFEMFSTPVVKSILPLSLLPRKF